MDKFQHKGLWWLPNKKQKKVGGTLSFSNDTGLQLQLVGGFNEDEFFNDNPAEWQHPIILRTTESGTLVTLYECRQSESTLAFSGYIGFTYSAELAFLGDHFEESSKLKFSEVNVQYSHLPDWLQISGFFFHRDLENHRIGITYQIPEDIKVTIPEAHISIYFGLSTNSDGLESYSFRQSSGLNFKLTEAADFNTIYLRWVYPFQNFLGLGTLIPNYTTSLKLIAESDHNSQSEVNVFFKQRPYISRSEQRVLQHHMLFTLRDIVDQLEEVFEAWVNISKDIKSIINLFFGIQYNPRMYLEQKFLYIIQAVESYHRNRMNNQVLPEDMHKARVASILANTPAEHRPWLQERLNYSNEPSLRNRLKELLQASSDIVSPLIKDEKLFINNVVNTRNYLTHFDSSLKTKVATGPKLSYLSQSLSYLLQSCLLKEIGLPFEKQKELFNRNQVFSILASRVRDGAINL